MSTYTFFSDREAADKFAATCVEIIDEQPDDRVLGEWRQ